MIEFRNKPSVGVITEGITIYREDELSYCVEWRMRTQPFIGMKQPTPNGAFLGSECVLALKVANLKAASWRYRLFENGEEVGGGFTNARGESSGIRVKMPYRGAKEYAIEVLGPIPAPELSPDFE